MFPAVREAVAKVINPPTLRWIAFSHFESDECGALNEFLSIAPDRTTALQLGWRNGECERFCAAIGPRSSRR
jgi:flavorubredoxin